MEADLVGVYGASLPEDWRHTRVPSFRRLLVIVRHLPAESAVHRALGDLWPIGWDLLDDIRRGVLARPGKVPDIHPARPAGRAVAASKRAKALRRAQAAENAKAREAARQERLTAARKE